MRTIRPIFSRADTAGDAVEALVRDGWDFVFIDTPPAFLNVMQDAITHANLVLIPLRPGAIDLIASEDAVLAAQKAGVGYLCVLNDAEPAWKTTRATRDYLVEGDVTVAKTIIAHRKPYLAAMTSGNTGPEVEDRKRKCGAEVDALWGEIKKALADKQQQEKHRVERIF